MLLAEAAEDEALQFAAGMQAAGFPIRLVPLDRLPAVPPAEQAQGAVLEPGRVRWRLTQGEAALADPELRVLAAAAYHQTIQKTVTKVEGPTAGQQLASFGLKMATGLPINIGGKKREVKTTQSETELAFHLELLGGEPLRRIRVDASAFDFSCLGARMQVAALPNFRTLLVLLAERAAPSALNLGARVLLAGQPVSTMGYETAADLEREERWRLALSLPH